MAGFVGEPIAISALDAGCGSGANHFAIGTAAVVILAAPSTFIAT